MSLMNYGYKKEEIQIRKMTMAELRLGIVQELLKKNYRYKEKLEAFRDLLESTEDRLIVFYNFNEELTRLRKICESLNREVSFVNGSGRSMYAYECVDNSVTFVQYQAGAMGGNYQKANKIVYFTLPLGKGSCDLWEQSKKRIHRIGQNRPCYYYYLLVKGSFEERNLAALQEGKELTDELFT